MEGTMKHVFLKNSKDEVYGVKVTSNKSMLLTGTVPTKFIFSDAGRSESKRPKQDNDCTVRALALACEVSYDEAYDYLKDAGRKSGRGFHIQKLLDKCAKNGTPVFGKRVMKYSFPASKGMERMYVAAFCVMFGEGRYITRQAGHVAAVINGHVYDVSYSAFRCVYVAYQFTDL